MTRLPKKGSKTAGRTAAAGKRRVRSRPALIEEARARLEQMETAGSKLVREKVQSQYLLHELQVHQIELEMQNDELRAALRDAQTARERYSELFELLPVGILVVDRSGLMLDANLATEIWLGGSRSVLKKKNIRFLFQRDDLARFEEFFKRMVETKARQTVEVRLRDIEPAPIWVQITGVSMQADSEGEQAGFYIAMVDITQRVSSEQVLARDKEAIERIVESRSKELRTTQMALEKAKRLADIGELATTVAHELRNPLAAISVAAANIRRKAETALVEQYIATIDKKIRESDRIINNLLFYSRLKSPRLERVDLCGAIKEVITELQGRAESAKRFSVVCKDGGGRGLVVEADPTQLSEMLSNLMSNAYDAISDGGVIEISAEEDGRGNALIHITDNGVGVAAEDLKKIWRPFYSTKSKGTGLGLAVVNQIVTLHGGSVVVESEPDKGTTVTVRLPLKQRSGGANGAGSA